MRNLYALFFISTLCAFLNRQTDKELFLQARQLYGQKQFAHAAETYEKIMHKGSAVFHNLGNCAYQQDDFLHALLYWYRAQKGASLRQKYILHEQIADAQKKLGIYQDPSFLRKLATSIRIFVSAVSLFVWQLLVILLMVVLALIIFFVPQRVRIQLLVFCTLVLALSALALLSNYRMHNSHSALVVSEHSQLYVGRDQRFSVKDTLARGTRVQILDKNTGWYKIQATHSGWMLEGDIVEI